MRVRFAQSARRHRVAAGRARQVLADPVVIVPITRVGEDRTMWLYLGDDATGRALEVGVCVLEDETLLVIHAMDLRAKYRGYYEHGKEGP